LFWNLKEIVEQQGNLQLRKKIIGIVCKFRLLIARNYIFLGLNNWYIYIKFPALRLLISEFHYY